VRIFAIILMIIPSISYAANWVEIYPDASIWIDTTSVSQKGAYKKAWFKTSHTIAEDGNQFTKYKQYKETKELTYFDCKSHESLTIEIFYYMDTNFLGSYSSPVLPSLFSEVAPDTIGEFELNLVCNKKALR
jgi:hypothetical protein